MAAQHHRLVEVDIARATTPLDRFFDLSVGSDYFGTLSRDDAQAQLMTAVDKTLFTGTRSISERGAPMAGPEAVELGAYFQCSIAAKRCSSLPVRTITVSGWSVRRSNAALGRSKT